MSAPATRRALCEVKKPNDCNLVQNPACVSWMSKTDKRLHSIENLLAVISEDMKGVANGIEIKNAILKRLEQGIVVANSAQAGTGKTGPHPAVDSDEEG